MWFILYAGHVGHVEPSIYHDDDGSFRYLCGAIVLFTSLLIAANLHTPGGVLVYAFPRVLLKLRYKQTYSISPLCNYRSGPANISPYKLEVAH
jgi:hypothetical protein